MRSKLVTKKQRIYEKECEIAFKSRYMVIYSCGRKTPISEISLFDTVLNSVKKYYVDEIRDYNVNVNDGKLIDGKLINEIVEEIIYHINSHSHNDNNEFSQISGNNIDIEFRGFDKGIDVLEHDINLDEYEFSNIIMSTIKKIENNNINVKAIWGVSKNYNYIANLFVKVVSKKVYYPKFDAVSDEQFVSLYYDVNERYLGLFVQRIAMLEVSVMAYVCRQRGLNCVFYRYP